jgi:xanthine dehydrogenase accessory factor
MESAFGRIVVEMFGDQAEGNAPICGGTASLAIFIVNDRAAYAAASEQLDKGRPVGIACPIDGERMGDPVGVADAEKHVIYGPGVPIDDAAMTTALGSGFPAISQADGLLYDAIVPQDRLLILDGGHVGHALARLGAELEFRVCVGDSRQDLVDPGRFPARTETRLGEFADIVAAYPFGASTCVVVVSPSHSSDLECVRAILKREYRYAGFIGSRRKTRMILDQAIADGFPSEKVTALRGPIGANIGAETPAEIAVAIFAEIIAVRRNSPAIMAMDKDRVRRRA